LRLLGVSILPLLFVCYKLSVSKTIAEYKLYKTNLENELTISSANNSALSLEKRSQQISQFIKIYSLDTLNDNKSLLNFVTEFCNDNRLQLKEYKPLDVSKYDSISVLTRQVTVEGEFLNCLQLAYALENQINAGRVSAATYKSYIVPKDKTVRLNCTLYVQNVIN